MEALDQYNHYHTGIESTANIWGLFFGYHLIGIHSVSLYFSFLNIASERGNNIFYYTPANFIIIPDGCYSLNSFNKYIQTIIPLTKVVPSYNGLNLIVASYANASDRSQDINRTNQAVNSSSPLND